MTLVASREGKRGVKVGATYGSAHFDITEDAAHLRQFHTQLGALLDEIAGENAPPSADKFLDDPGTGASRARPGREQCASQDGRDLHGGDPEKF